ncbi:MAG: helix-turn-helix domain-containing protein [Eubacteriales bacterium]|nr:helix-turn-helix domain-containing protein [Eubacteriales bacterium]
MEKTMQNDNCQKIKLLRLMELLRQETDENHPITTSEICRRLGEMGISCERRTVGKDMKLLQSQGFEIMSELKGHENSYWIADRSFELPELKILMDAVQAALFIPEDKTEDLLKKIAALGGTHQAELLQGNLVHFNTRKHSNRSVYYNI